MSGKTNRQELIDEAESLRLKFPSNITAEKLEILISKGKTTEVDELEELRQQFKELQAQVANKGNSDNITDIVQALTHKSNTSGEDLGISVLDTPDRVNKIKKAFSLIRCKVSPRDPAKQSHSGEEFSTSNDLIGSISWTVEYGNTTHIPYCIYTTLKDKLVSILSEDIESGNEKIGKSKGGYESVEAYNITLMKPLTQKELDNLARKQRLRSDNLEDRSEALLGIDTTTKKTTIDTELEALGYNI